MHFTVSELLAIFGALCNRNAVVIFQDRSKIMYGQWWRFYTTTLLHANLLHLLVGPCLPRRSSSSLVVLSLLIIACLSKLASAFQSACLLAQNLMACLCKVELRIHICTCLLVCFLRPAAEIVHCPWRMLYCSVLMLCPGCRHHQKPGMSGHNPHTQSTRQHVLALL